MSDKPVTLYRAPFVVSEEGVIQDGAVLVARDTETILTVGRFCDLKDDSRVINDFEGAMVPALINAHTHLELSHLAALGREEPSEKEDMTVWIRKLLAIRRQSEAIGLHNEAVPAGLALLRQSGCVAAADIGNDPLSGTFSQHGKVRVLFFHELLGLSREGERNQLNLLERLNAENGCDSATLQFAPHAPYTTGPALIRRIKEISRIRGRVMPIHTAESADEIEFLYSGSGPFREFLEELGFWDSSFIPPGIGAVAYLERLGVLDEKTLCVHCVHLAEQEIEILVDHGSRVCICLGSNKRLGVGLPPLPQLLARHLLPALGTDSLASNSALNLWGEMQLVRQEYTGVAPQTVFRMATRAGAVALGLEEEFGLLAPGKKAAILGVRYQGKGGEDLFDFLTATGKQIEMEWLCG